MTFVEATDLYEGDPARLALLSTFQFDPAFFEKKLLHMPALAQARRIVVFMDAGQWSRLLEQDAPARLLNRRYLVVPVTVPQGVFHPKLTLLASPGRATVLCGSNNLTRAGTFSNLELLNSLSCEIGPDEDEETLGLAAESCGFSNSAALTLKCRRVALPPNGLRKKSTNVAGLGRNRVMQPLSSY
jgi:hypothetical protein